MNWGAVVEWVLASMNFGLAIEQYFVKNKVNYFSIVVGLILFILGIWIWNMDRK